MPHTLAKSPPVGAYWMHSRPADPRPASPTSSEPPAKPGPSETRAARLKRFVAAFGVACGTRYAAEGLTFKRAKARHVQFVEAVRRFGEISAEPDARAARRVQLSEAVGPNLARFAAALKIPGKRPS
jgi:hypothetical protein